MSTTTKHALCRMPWLTQLARAPRLWCVLCPWMLVLALTLWAADVLGEDEAAVTEFTESEAAGTKVAEDEVDLDALVKSLPGTADDPNAGVRAQLLVLAEIQGTIPEAPFYQRCLDQIAKNPSKRDIPVLESLLNSNMSWENPRWHTSRIIRSLREKASKLWYDLVWADAGEATKIRTALFGFQPFPPVRPEHSDSFDRMKQLGKAAREELYNTLTRPHDKLNHDAWTVISVGTAIDLLQEPDFTPTKAELGRLLKSPGAFGQRVGLAYAAKYAVAEFPAGFDEFVEANLSDPEALYHMTGYASHVKELLPEGRAQLQRTVIRMGGEAKKQIDASRDGLPESMWFGVLYRVNVVLHVVGPGPKGEEYLRAYQVYREQLNTDFIERGNEKYQANVKFFLEWADGRAQAGLAKEE